mgnify:CR=1 FL=1
MVERNARIEDELFPFYALDALTAEEREEVERYVAADPAARLRLAELTAAAMELGAAAPPLAPSPAIKANLMARVATDAATTDHRPQTAATTDRRTPTVEQTTNGKRPSSAVRRPSSPRSWWSWVPAVGFAAAVLGLLLAGGLLLRQSRQIDQLQGTVATLEQTVNDLEGDLGAVQVQNEELRGQLQARDDQLASLLAPGAITVALGDLTGEHPDAHGALTIDPSSGEGVLSVANLPPLSADQTYQAWLIVEGTPVSMGTFQVDASGAASHSISDARPGAFDAVGVSIEPAGGSEQPTPDQIILLAGLST